MRALIAAGAFLFMGVFSVWQLVSATRDGRMRGRYQDILRDKQPAAFWFYVVLYIAGVIAAVFGLLVIAVLS